MTVGVEGHRRRSVRQALRTKLARTEWEIPPSYRRGLYAGGAALMAAGAFLFLRIVADVQGSTGLASLDPAVTAWFVEHRSEAATVLAVVLATVFGPVAMPVIVVVVCGLWARKARWAWRPVLLAGAMLLGLVLVQLLTRVVNRPRPPEEIMLLGHDPTSSFPSGHITATADFMLVGEYLIVSRAFTLLRALMSTLLALAVIVAETGARLYLGYHWLTDGLGSGALSLVVFGAALIADAWHSVAGPPG
ncbi:phosphatase PAP2 family protein [Sinomonas halotolerans]|uniref:Phosphatase PAP2 family protein n=1 Tax=Sinomonas halotolerans TaxID=1644133 RepID=A0ABU9X6M9_9MICC